MKLFNLRHPDETVDFSVAVRIGMGRDRGLFFPTMIPQIADVATLLKMPFVERSQEIIATWLADEMPRAKIDSMVASAFNFPLPLRRVDEKRSVLELFHGPTLAFKDFGARFMAQCLADSCQGETITILTATSGDTGAAVAHAFYGVKNVRVVVLYPAGKISLLQEKLFCTLGGNVTTIAISSDFDACQELVKKSFVDADLQKKMRLNSANSINISRLLAQVCYYFEAVAASEKKEPVLAVPSGNFGNLTAGLLAQAMGLPIKRFIAATNSNDTVPRYLKNSLWQPRQTIATASNAMDVAEPSNWPRVEAVFSQTGRSLNELEGIAVSEIETRDSLAELHDCGYVCEPHAAVAAAALQSSLQNGEHGVFLGTAHPAKFRDVVENALGINIALPPVLEQAGGRAILSTELPPNFPALKDFLLKL